MKRVLFGSVMVLVNTIAIGDRAIAQVVPDNTLGTQVTQTGTTFEINNGMRSGNNLFHSFSQFSVPTGGSAIFNNALDVQNIFSRVTGSQSSTIDGILKSQGTANLFLMNPNGIVFGPNARLELGGSFLGTTASVIKFEDGIEFNTVNTSPLLSVKVPIGLQMGTNPGAIQVQGNGYALGETDSIGFSPTIQTGPIALVGKPGTTFALVGQGIQFQGASVGLQGGNLELGSVAGGSSIRLIPNVYGFSLDYAPDIKLADITIGERSLLDLSGSLTSQLNLVGQTVRIQDGSVILSQNVGAELGRPITVRADRLDISGSDPQTGLRSGISSETLGVGAGATISIVARQVTLAAGGGILSKNYSESTSGEVVIQAGERLQVDGFAPNNPLLTTNLGSLTLSKGKPGNVRLSAPLIQVMNGAGIVSSTFQEGAAADLILQSDRLEMSGATVFGSPSSVSSSSFGSGNSGEVRVETRSLQITDGADLSTSSYNRGNAGNVWVNAIDHIEVSGRSIGGASSITSSLRPLDSPIYRELLGLPEIPQGSAGKLTIQTASLDVSQGGRIYAGNEGHGNAGLLSISAERVTLLSQGTIEAKTLDGQGGNIEINASRAVVMRGESSISSSAGTAGNGGNITIDSPIIVGLENSDIIANAVKGKGGNIQITTQSLFGLNYRTILTNQNDITASSEFGINGNVQVNTIGINPVNSLNALPTDITDSSRQIADRCNAAKTSSFIATGRGGIPNNPNQRRGSDRPWNDLRPLTATHPIATPVAQSHPVKPLIEASAIQVDKTGLISLVAAKPIGLPAAATCGMGESY